MNMGRLVWKEFLFSKLTTLLSLLAVAGATAYSVATITMLRAQEAQTAAQVAAMDDEIRKITKNMGFNINILPREQNLSDFYAQDFAEKTMPFEFVHRLADSKEIVTVNHLRPALIQKVDWPEQKRQIILMGVQGVVPWTHRPNPAKPLANAVPEGKIVIGHQLSKELSLDAGNTTTLFGREVVVDKVFPPRGNKDDITLFVDLAVAQQILQLPDRINLIQALECNCASIDRLAEIEAEISQVLGDEVQVIELSTTAIARAKARTGIKDDGVRRLAAMRGQSAALSLIAVFGASLLVGLMFMVNVNQRRGEIGILRALGVSTTNIMGLFLSKACLLGLLGAVVGYGGGLYWGWIAQPRFEGVSLLGFDSLFVPSLMIAAMIFAPLLTLLASWLPALSAAGQQPASILARD